jgi:hypothetical protein
MDWTDANGRTYGDFERRGDTFNCADEEMAKVSKARREGRMAPPQLKVQLINPRRRDPRSVKRDQPEAAPTASLEVSMQIIKINDVEYVDFEATFEGLYSNGDFVFRVDEGEMKGERFTMNHALNDQAPGMGWFGLPEFKTGHICPNQHTVRIHASYARMQGILAPAQQ